MIHSQHFYCLEALNRQLPFAMCKVIRKLKWASETPDLGNCHKNSTKLILWKTATSPK